MGVTDILTASREGRDKGGLCGAFYVTAELGPIHLTQMPQMSYLLELDMLGWASLVMRQPWPF